MNKEEKKRADFERQMKAVEKIPGKTRELVARLLSEVINQEFKEGQGAEPHLLAIISIPNSTGVLGSVIIHYGNGKDLVVPINMVIKNVIEEIGETKLPDRPPTKEPKKAKDMANPKANSKPN